MHKRRRGKDVFSRGVWIAVVLGIVALAMVVFLGGGGETARAACGASASSCKTCHEINRKKPVNTNGDWHKQHAMGDYCSFCHGGNVQAQDETGAHAGLVLGLYVAAAAGGAVVPHGVLLVPVAVRIDRFLPVDLVAGLAGAG